jgi:hypothetical protein
MNFLAPKHTARQAAQGKTQILCDKIFHSLFLSLLYGCGLTLDSGAKFNRVRRKIWYDFIRAEKYSEKKLRLIDGAGPVSSVFIYVAQQQIPAAGASLASLSGVCKFESITSSAGCAEKYRRLNISIKCGFGVFARRRLIWSPGWKMVHKQPAAAAKGLHKGIESKGEKQQRADGVHCCSWNCLHADQKRGLMRSLCHVGWLACWEIA